jgi:hypothetical protein
MALMWVRLPPLLLIWAVRYCPVFVAKDNMHTIVILSDGETWNEIGGCSICTITNEEFNKLCNDEIDAGDLNPISEVGLTYYGPRG